MADKKPNVFPTTETTPTTPETPVVQTPEIPTNQVSEAQMEASREMIRRTEQQLREREAALNAPKIDAVPIEALNYNQLADMSQNTTKAAMANHPAMQTAVIPEPVSSNTELDNLVTPKWDAAYDMIPLPSKGKTYKGVKSSVKVSYMTGSDENILTSANLLESGGFLKVLISRNLLEPNLKYEDLLVGDRNAIMIWLRGSSFGNMYPITIINDNGVAEEIEYDLNDLKYIYMDKDPDENGLFDFTCPQSGDVIKYRYLTVRDEDEIEAQINKDEENKLQVNHRSAYTLQRQIASVNGNSDAAYLTKYIEDMRLGDIRAFRRFYDDNESGVNLSIEVETAGGKSVKTFLPFNFNFFWSKS